MTYCGLSVSILLVAVGAPYAHADSFVYTYDVTFDPAVYGATFTTKPMQAAMSSDSQLLVDL